MGRVIVVEFVSVDGVMQDPDGREGFARGGWAFRYGPEAVAGDKFLLGDVLDTGALLLGRRTWEPRRRTLPWCRPRPLVQPCVSPTPGTATRSRAHWPAERIRATIGEVPRVPAAARISPRESDAA